MSKLCRCIKTICCTSEDEGETQQQDDHLQESSIENYDARQPPRVNAMSMRMFFRTPTAYSQVALSPGNSNDKDDNGNNETNVDSSSNNHSKALTIMFGRPLSMFRQCNNYRRGNNENNNEKMGKKDDIDDASSSFILRKASTFNDDDRGQGLLSIPYEEIVMPGSELQKKMAQIMLMKLKGDDDDDSQATEMTIGDECVICMEGFDDTNPRMPTLCGCGENKTFFHLPCLYQWIQQQGSNDNGNCPSCRESLRWEEF